MVEKNAGIIIIIYNLIYYHLFININMNLLAKNKALTTTNANALKILEAR